MNDDAEQKRHWAEGIKAAAERAARDGTPYAGVDDSPGAPVIRCINPERGFVRGNVEVVSRKAAELITRFDHDPAKMRQRADQRPPMADELRSAADWLGAARAKARAA